LSDAITASDNIIVTQIFFIVQNESSISSTFENSTAVFVDNVSEPFTVLESSAGNISILTNVSDNTFVSDDVVILVVVTLNDNLTIIDSVTSVAQFYAQRNDTNSSTDTSNSIVTKYGKATIEQRMETIMLRKNYSANVSILLKSSLDHLTAISGLAPTIRISKVGGAFNTVTRPINDLGFGIYSIQLSSSDTDTSGELTIIAEDPFNIADSTVLVTTVQDEALTKGEFIALS
jgi:hypothetical protein